MSDSYGKLFSSITESTVWSEPYPTRLVWIAFVAKANRRGEVFGAVPGIARMANVTLAEAEAALAALMAPDPYSRTKDHDGRRIEAIDGGWRLLNHAKYAEMRSVAERAEYQREWDRANRSKRRQNESDKSDTIRQVPTKPDQSDPTSSSSNYKQEQKQKTAPKGVDLLVDIDPQVAADFKALRLKLRAPITKTALDGIRREAGKAGLTLEAALTICCERGWRGFKADWVAPSRNGNGSHRESAAGSVARANAEAEASERADADAIEGDFHRV